jgi:hypothetical protein
VAECRGRAGGDSGAPGRPVVTVAGDDGGVVEFRVYGFHNS